MAKKIIKIAAIVLAVLALGIYFSYDYWLEKELKYRLSEIINKDPNNLYKYSFSELNIKLLDGSVDLSGIVIEPSDWAYDSLRSETNNLRFVLRLNMEKIEMNGFEITEFMKTGNIEIRSLIISDPIFEYYFHPQKEHNEQASPLSNLFSNRFKEAKLGTFLISNAEIKILDQSEAAAKFSVHHLNIEMTQAKMDSITLNSYLPFYYEDISISAAGISIDAAKEFTIKSDSLFFVVKDRTFGLKNFQVNPKYNMKSFAKLYNVQKQWFAIKLDSLVLNNINIDTFIHNGHVEIGKIEVIKPNIALYKDKSKPLPPFKKKLLPASAIRSIPWVLEVDTLTVKNGYISINETSPVTGEDSFLTFEELDALVLNFNNDEGLRSSQFLRMSMNTMVLGKVLTKLHLSFDLMSTTDRFTAAGNLGTVKASTFNTVLEPMMGVKVADGMINDISFKFTSDDKKSVGTLDADYEKIKIEVINTDTTKEKQQKKGFMSLAANTAVKSNNSMSHANYIQGIINTERVQEKDVWPYLWHSIQSGLISTLAPFTNSKEARQKQKKVRQQLKEDKKGGN